jgi:hypothetical protein
MSRWKREGGSEAKGGGSRGARSGGRGCHHRSEAAQSGIFDAERGGEDAVAKARWGGEWERATIEAWC